MNSKFALNLESRKEGRFLLQMKQLFKFSLTILAHINSQDIARLITIRVKTLKTNAPGYLKQSILYC